MSSVTEERRLQKAINRKEIMGRSLKYAHQVNMKRKNILEL